MNLNGLPVYDATHDFKSIIKPRDIKGAKARNPEECVVARNVKRVLNGSVGVVKIGAHVAYVQMEDHVLRYIVSPETKQMVKAYDQLEHYPAGVPVRLLAPTATSQIGNSTIGKKPAKKPGTGKPRMAARPWLRHIGQPVAS